MTEVPENKCGYMWPEEYNIANRSYRQSCCWRDTYKNSERCVWHADPAKVGEKPVGVLRHSETRINDLEHRSVEILDGAVLTEIKFENLISFSGYFLRGADLSRVDLSGAKLVGAQLSGTNLTDANFSHANLTGANLQDTDFTNASLFRARLADSHLFDADLIDATIVDADLTDAVLATADLTNAMLGTTTLTNADLNGADLTNAVLGGADLTNADLTDADLSNATLKNADLTNADLADADLTNATLKNADLTNANLTNATLTDSDFTDSSLRWASLADTTARRADFTNSHLVGANLEGSSLTDTRFDGANLSGVQLYGTKLQAVSINDQTAFGEYNVYEQEADPCDPWHPLDGDPTTPTSLSKKFVLAVRSGQALQSGFHSSGKILPTEIIPRTKQAINRFRHHLILDAGEQREVGNRLKKATSVYRIRQRLQRENSRPRDVAEPYVREQHCRRKRAFATGSYWEWFKHATYRWVMLYGESPARVVGTSIAVVAVFAGIYSVVGGIVIGGEEPDLIGNIYFSAVTFSTLGYGGIEPTTTTTQLLASVQSLIGGILIALLVAVFGRRALR